MELLTYRGRLLMPVQIRGVTYQTVRHAAEALGVTKGSIWAAIERGTVDNVGLPKVHKGAPCKPVRLDGKKYPSVNAAAEALGVHPTTITYRIKRQREGMPLRYTKVVR